MHPTDAHTAREAAITATLALEQSGTNNAMGRIARRKLQALGVDLPETRTDRNVADAVDDAVMAAHAAGGVWENFWTEVIAEFDEWFASLPPVEPEWPEGEPGRAPIVVPPAYFALFKREVADEREVHFGLSHTLGEDADGDSARTVWAFDEILAQLPAGNDPGGDVEVMVPVHPDCSGRLSDWLRAHDCYPYPMHRAVEGLEADTPEGRRAGMVVVRAWLSVLEQLDGLNVRATA